MALRATKRGRYSVFENLGEVTRGELETLRKETRRLAKVANQRLVRMDAMVEKGPYRLSPAALRAYEDLRTEFGAPRRRYREAVSTASREELIREYRSLREFVTAVTSTVKGYTRLVNERYKNFKKLTGADISLEDYIDAWEKITADDKAKETFYRSQFALIKEASEEWNAEKRAAEEEEREPKGSYQAILADKLKEWNGKSFIQTLRSAASAEK